MPNQFDDTIVLALNAYAGRSVNFDGGIEFFASNHLFKGAIFVSLFWWFWFRRAAPDQLRKTREHLVSTLIAGIVGIFVARALALSLPFRIRPRYEPSLHFHIPAEASFNDFVNWSGFPSDHAVLYTALSVGIAFISLRAGILAMVYSLIVVAFPRVYLGFHYPTDILAGILLGGIIGYVFNTPFIRQKVTRSLLLWEQQSPHYFYVAYFIVCFQIATMFESLRSAAVAVHRVIERLIG